MKFLCPKCQVWSHVVPGDGSARDRCWRCRTPVEVDTLLHHVFEPASPTMGADGCRRCGQPEVSAVHSGRCPFYDGQHTYFDGVCEDCGKPAPDNPFGGPYSEA